jgi:hypothetical protein
MPTGKAISPMLNAVPSFSNSQDETVSLATVSFALASVFLSAWGGLMTYFTLLPSL